MKIQDFFKDHKNIAIAFSGGVDSSYLLYEAIKANTNVTAYYINTQFQPEFELNDAKKLAKELDANLKIINKNILINDKITSNPKNRCYYCKKEIFATIIEAAKKDGYTQILDGTNFSDDINDRPGMKALKEMNVYSPLRICELTKDEIREKSKQAGLFTYNKPSYACLATRVKTKEKITSETLNKIEECENFLFSLGFKDFRVRTEENTAKIQVKQADFPVILKKREEIYAYFKKQFDSVTLDLKTR